MLFVIAFFSLIGLVVLHELGHFFMAKKFGVRVEEFGIGLPPRLIGRKMGETLYSLNLLPLGAFVRLTGEDGESKDPRSFGQRSLVQRALIIGAGVVAFWVIAFFIFSALATTTGIPASVSDETNENILNAQVRILAVAPESPAKEAGLKAGDRLRGFDRIGDFQGFIGQNKGAEVLLEIGRGKESFSIPVVPRQEPPAGQGPLGIQLVRTGNVKYAWYEVPLAALEKTAGLTLDIARGLVATLQGLFRGSGLPQGVDVVGPVGILDLLANSFAFGIGHFFAFLAVLSVYLALFNVLPIPAVDGGRLFFLALEAVRKKPIGTKVEQRINTFFFALLITFMIWVTIKDITRIFF